MLARWSKTLSSDSDYSFQVYFDRVERRGAYLKSEIDTWDADFQHRFVPFARNEIVWGLGYRLIADELDGTYSSTYLPDSKQDQIFSVFLQDQVAIVEDRLFLTPGLKLEHNDFTGWEVQPGVRTLFRATEHHSLWTSVARAVRTPARFEHGFRGHAVYPSVPNFTGAIRGNPEFESENLTAYEAGWRMRPSEALFVDLALFYNDYDDLRSTERGAVVPGNPAILPVTYMNLLEGKTYGAELAPMWQVTENWRLSAGYSWLQTELHRKPGSTDATAEGAEGDSPENQFHLRSFLDLPHNLELDAALYYVDSLFNQQAPSHTRLDVRFGWRPTDQVELSLAFQNVLDPRHAEFGSTTPLVTPTEVQRSVHGRMTWRF
jgi:iron complex outermembrane receptor protein